jgi:hypothetical protein
MASLYSGTWHFSSLEGIGKSSSYVLLDGYGKNSRTQKAGPAYTIFVVSLDLSLSLSLSLPCVLLLSCIMLGTIILDDADNIDRHRKVRDSHDGLIIQRNMALFFSGGDRKELKLRVTGRIWKEQQNKEGGACIHNLCS